MTKKMHDIIEKVVYDMFSDILPKLENEEGDYHPCISQCEGCDEDICNGCDHFISRSRTNYLFEQSKE